MSYGQKVSRARAFVQQAGRDSEPEFRKGRRVGAGDSMAGFGSPVNRPDGQQCSRKAQNLSMVKDAVGVDAVRGLGKLVIISKPVFKDSKRD